MAEKKRNIQRFFKWFSVGVVVFVIIILIAIKNRNPDFNTGTFFIVIAFLGIGALGIIFSTKIFSWFKKKEPKIGELPPPISDDECFKIVEKILRSSRYANYIDEVNEDGSETLGEKIKSEIYTARIKGYFSDKGERIKYAFIINKHFADSKRKVLINPSDEKVNVTKSRMASYPERQPNIKEITEDGPLGTKTTKEITYPDEKKDKEELK